AASSVPPEKTKIRLSGPLILILSARSGVSSNTKPAGNGGRIFTGVAGEAVFGIDDAVVCVDIWFKDEIQTTALTPIAQNISKANPQPSILRAPPTPNRRTSAQISARTPIEMPINSMVVPNV